MAAFTSTPQIRQPHWRRYETDCVERLLLGPGLKIPSPQARPVDGGSQADVGSCGRLFITWSLPINESET